MSVIALYQHDQDIVPSQAHKTRTVIEKVSLIGIPTDIIGMKSVYHFAVISCKRYIPWLWKRQTNINILFVYVQSSDFYLILYRK